MIKTGTFSSQLAPRPEAIRIANTGSYVIAHNKIDCEWQDPDAIGIGVFSQFGAWHLEHAVVINNDVTMSPPPGTVFGDFSAGISIRGFTGDNLVANNRIGGHARAALALDVFPLSPRPQGIPTNNALILNRVDDFEGAPVARSQECSNMQVRIGMAERVGFEPTVGVNLHTLSKRAP